mgnify:CR=1 FL=1
MIFIPRLKPRFVLVRPCPDVSVILSEVSEHLFHGEGYNRVLGLIDGCRSSDRIIDSASAEEPPEMVCYRLLRLERDGFLEEAGLEDSPGRLLLDAAGTLRFPEPVQPVPAGAVRPVYLGIAPRDALSAALLNAGISLLEDIEWGDPKAGEADEPWLVVVDDYLEPELEAMNALALKDGREWMIFKPAGVMLLAGPRFVPGTTPCWRCLAGMLRGHRYVEALVNRGAELYRPLDIPMGWTDTSLAAASSLLARELRRQGSPPEEGPARILSFDLSGAGERQHLLRTLEGCPACRLREQDRDRGKPLSLAPRRKYPGSENGRRIRPPSETLEHLQWYVSRLTGVIGRVKEFHPDMQVYGRQFQATYPAPRTVECLRSVRADRFGVAHGKGRSEAQARVSAMAEAVERYSARLRTGDRTLLLTTADAGPDAVAPGGMVLLSPRQRRLFSETCAAQGRSDPFLPDTPIDWVPAWSLARDEWRQVPAFAVRYPFATEHGYKPPGWTTSGLSAGSCLEEAILQGLLEIIERDAFTIWWYNRLVPAGWDLRSFGSPDADLLARRMDDAGWEVHILDLTTDLGVPVLAAAGISRTDPDRDPVFGFGADPVPAVALSRAMGEMAAEWKSASDIFRMNENAQRFLGKRFSDLDFIRPKPGAPLREATSAGSNQSGDLLEDIRALTGILAAGGMEPLVADLTRSEAPLRVVRVIVPGTRQILPHMGPGRLYDVPVRTGALKEPRSERQMNPMPFWQLLNRVGIDSGP